MATASNMGLALCLCWSSWLTKKVKPLLPENFFNLKCGTAPSPGRYVPASIEQRFYMGSEFSFSDFFTNIFVD